MHLSDHFTLREMTKSAYALRHDIDNTPSDQIIQRLSVLAGAILEPIRKHFALPFSPTSAYRSLDLNRALGSGDSSQHIKGEAVDIVLPGISTYDLALWISKNLTFDQLILEFYRAGDVKSGWVHCSYVQTAQRRQLLTYNGVSYENGLTA